MRNITAKNIDKSYGNGVKALRSVSLDIRPGEFVSLLGPSGCGKSTLLRIVAGLERMDGGELLRGDEDFAAVPVQRRSIGMVFQHYALFPNMTVLRNVMFGLEMAGMDKPAAAKAAKDWLARVHLGGREDAYPHQLSGGQQQRVALARALATNPRIFLLDEPLSALDASVRHELRDEIRRLQLELGVTTLYVTHDQAEALAISDRVAVMKDGRMMEVESPDAIYHRPGNLFTAEFIGASTRLDGTIMAGEPHYALLEERFVMRMPPLVSGVNVGDAVAVVVRAEEIALVGDGEDAMPGVVTLRSFLGDAFRYKAEVYPGKEILVNAPLGGKVFQPGDRVRLSVSERACHVFDPATGGSLVGDIVRRKTILPTRVMEPV